MGTNQLVKNICKEALVEQVVCLKRLIASAFRRSESLHLLRLMDVLAPSLHIESTDSLILTRTHCIRVLFQYALIFSPVMQS